ncbi:hypothetical protein D3874_21790 [Oleomonas cavernae]|uniref:Uncharacterized protein n=1 Tax=Oleomonas cavernae TaxID=2320859 RepID=A0A418WGW5_9PROT|nr:hypothetical protein D3874_21790 [Oleomonas cavernae]
MLLPSLLAPLSRVFLDKLLGGQALEYRRHGAGIEPQAIRQGQDGEVASGSGRAQDDELAVD